MAIGKPPGARLAGFSPDARDLLRDATKNLHEGRFALVEPGSFLIAVVSSDGQLLWSDLGFTEVVGDFSESADCRRLINRSRKAGRATGLVVTPSRGTLVVQVCSVSGGVSWPLPAEGLAALSPGAALVVAFAPSRSGDLARETAETLGLAPREADLSIALLEAPSLQLAAARVGMSRATAKDALARACRRVGARNASELVSRLLDVACGEQSVDAGAVGSLLGLTPTEASVAAASALGETMAETARRLELAEGTVKSYRKAIYAKLGVTRDRDLRRLVTEASRAVVLEGMDEIVRDDRAKGERLRLIRRPDDRRVAYIDYGPARGRPLMVTHGHSDWRRLPIGFVERLHRDGWRPIVVQRPGFGLTSPATRDYLADGADDMAAVLDAAGGERVTVFSRGPSFPTALAFAERHPRRFERGVVANPHPSRRHPPEGGAMLFNMTRLLTRHPRMISFVIQQALQHSTTRSLRAMIERLYAEAEDELPPDRPDIVAHQVGDVQALYARTTRGVLDELSLYARGWSTPQDFAVGPWRIAISKDSWSRAEAESCVRLPGYERREIEGVVVLRAYTDPDSLADLLIP